MKQFNPINYKIRLEPDLHRFRFDASVEISFESADKVEEVSLNILELAIWSCKVRQDKEFEDCPFLIDPSKEVLRIFVPEAISDEQAFDLSRKLARRIEDELQYPGQIRITVIRETRCIEFAK